jgi:beta-phosphoglucomutase-like phosphatase (HAD superfamily)
VTAHAEPDGRFWAVLFDFDGTLIDSLARPDRLLTGLHQLVELLGSRLPTMGE